MEIVDLKNKKVKVEKYALGFAFAYEDHELGIVALADHQEIYCERCFSEVTKTYFPAYDEKAVNVLLTFPYTCSRCKMTIYPTEAFVVEEKKVCKG